jgi:hypothetical protein
MRTKQTARLAVSGLQRHMLPTPVLKNGKRKGPQGNIFESIIFD